MRRMLPAWAMPIVTILVLQTTAAYLTRLIPIFSPALMGEFGWSESSIGYLTAANSVGALFALITGAALIRRFGSTRALQGSLLIGAASVALFCVPLMAFALLASLLIGLSYGTASPAGSEVLQRFTPQANRNFVFSIRQAGIPLGGVIAGLMIPPLVEWAGWRTSLALAALVVTGATCRTWRYRSRIDRPSDEARTWTLELRSLRSLTVPLRALSSRPGLLRLSLAGALLIVAQSCWFAFTVTYLVAGLGLSLSVAGLVFAVMQAAGVIGRIMLGWIADRLGSAKVTLMLAAAMSAGTTALLGLSDRSWSVSSIVMLAVAAGASVAGWNGVQVAEVARRSPPKLVAETAAGSTILVYTSNIIAPAAFATFVAIANRFDYAFFAAGACSLLCIPLLSGLDRRTAGFDRSK